MAVPNSSPCLVSTLCCLLYVLSSVHVVPRAAALSFHFNFSDPDSTCTAQNAKLNCSDDAYFHSTERAIELTKNDMGDHNNHSVGRLTYAQPVPLWDGATGELASFTTAFTFRIKPARPDSPEPSADGMAFFLAHHAVAPPGSFGWNLGLFNDSTNVNATGDDRVVAVEFDTFQNAETEDVDGNHVGIDVNSIVSENSVSPNTSIKSGETLAAEVAYDNGTETLSVVLWVDGTPYRVSAAVDMRRSLPQMVAVGFSAATGSSVEVHQLLSWSFNSSLASRDNGENDVTSPGPGEAPAPVSSDEAITSKRHSKARSSTIAVSAAAAAFLVICALIGFVLRRKLKIWKKSASGGDSGGELDDEHDGGEAEFEKGVGPKRYCYSELTAATCNFSEEMKLGRGGFGHVYQGCLKIDGQDDRRVAIKKFSESSVQGRKEFEAEVKIISRLRHRNLVQLIGWCDSCKGLLIVYELVSEGSLDRHMYKNARLLTWPQRYKIIIGLGSALRYLHAEWEQCVVHGDIKPSNIMLDSSLDAKLGDFGLARLIDHGVRPATTKVVLGTAGYIDPELVNTRRPSAVSDVYSFGIVLLELVTGRRPVEEPDDSEELFVLVRWVWRLYIRNAIAEAVDERLLSLMISQGEHAGEVEERRRQMERALVVGIWCSHPDRSERPSIARAMHVLQSADVKLPVLQPQMMYSGDAFHTIAMGGDGYSDLSFGVTSTGSHTSTTSGCNSRSENE